MDQQIEKLYELLDDAYSPAKLELFKNLFIACIKEFGENKHHLVGIVLRIQGKFDCFFDDHREVNVMGEPGWWLQGDIHQREYAVEAYGRGGASYTVHDHDVHPTRTPGFTLQEQHTHNWRKPPRWERSTIVFEYVKP